MTGDRSNPTSSPASKVVLPRLYAIVDQEAASRAGYTVPDLMRVFLAAGVRFLQIRAKHTTGAMFLDWCRQARGVSAGTGALVVVNDRADIALMAGLNAVHVGQDDVPATQVRHLIGPTGIVGLSTHTRDQIDRACDEPISYMAVGPIFGTGSKATGYDPVGPALIAYAASRARVPIVAIGGLTIDNADSVFDAGAASAAVIGDLLVTGDPGARAAEWLTAVAGV